MNNEVKFECSENMKWNTMKWKKNFRYQAKSVFTVLFILVLDCTEEELEVKLLLVAQTQNATSTRSFIIQFMITMACMYFLEVILKQFLLVLVNRKKVKREKVKK